MEFFFTFDLTVFIILALCLLIFCFGVINDMETFVQQNMDTVLIVSIIIVVIFAIISVILVAKMSKKLSTGLISGLFSLITTSQLVAYLYFGLTAIAAMGFWRLIVFILFIIYGLVNIGVCLVAHFWIILVMGDDDKLCGFLPSIGVFAVGWFINFFLFFN